MGKPRDLANVVATGNILADGAVAPAELTGVNATAAELNILDGVTATAAELNLMDGVTATTAELNHVDGVTSNVQTQMDTKAPVASPTFTGTATAPTVNASTALQIGGVAVTATAAELNKMDGVTVSASDINSVTTKAPTADPTFTGTATAPTINASTALQIGGAAITATAAELNYVDGVTSNVQTQINTKSPTADPTFTGTLAAPTINATTAIQAGGTNVITSSRQLANIASVDATTVAALSAAGVGGGGGIELTTSEAVVEGDPLAWNFSTGKVEKIARTGGYASNTITVSGSTVSSTKDLIYIPEINKWALLFHDSNSGDHKTVIGTQAAGGTITWGTAVKVENVTNNRDGSRMVYDPNVSRLLVVARMDNGSGKAQTYSISGTSLTKTAESNFESSGINVSFNSPMNLHYHAASNKIICFYTLDSGGVPTVKVFTLGASTISVSSSQGPGNYSSGGGTVAGFGSNSLGLAFGISSVGSTIVFAYKMTNFKAIAATISGTTLTFGGDIDLSSNTPGNQDGLGKCIYLSGSSTANKFVAFFNYGNAYVGYNFTVSGTTLTYVDSNNTGAAYNSGVPAVGYDPTNDKGYVAWVQSNNFRAKVGDVVDSWWSTSGYTNVGSASGEIINGAYNPDLDWFTFINSESKYGYFYPQSDNFYYFVGCAKEAASANTTVKIANSGQVATGLSGLTTGLTYRINFSGGWSNYGNAITGPSDFANSTQRAQTNGVALSTTTMLLWNDMMSYS